MRIAFYAPMKAPGHPVPSGDRQMARLLVAALTAAGAEVELASSFRAYEGRGDGDRQARLARTGGRLADRLIRRYGQRPAAERPQLWFTYHLYHKAPDYLGPPVAKALAIPYVVAEASTGPRQAAGPWARGHAAAAAAIASADLMLALNRADMPCVHTLRGESDRIVLFPPFLDGAPFRAFSPSRADHRARLTADLRVPPDQPLLLTVAMMRVGAKSASYQVLGRALTALLDRPWSLAVAGDGPAAADVRAALAPLGPRIHFLGQCEAPALAALYAAADLFLWPAVDEAYGLVFLEAQAAGLPVVGGRAGGVADVVSDGETGVLVPPGDAHAFAQAVAALLDDAGARRTMGTAAAARVARHHDLPMAAARLGRLLTPLTTARRV